MLKLLSNGMKKGVYSDLLEIFAPLILDDMGTIISMGGDSPLAAETPHRSSFSERLTYYHELCHTGTPSEAWQPPRLETTYNYMRGALGAVIHYLKGIAMREKDGLDSGVAINALVGYIKSKTEDTAFRQTLASFDQALARKPGQAAGKNPQLQLMGYQTMGLEVFQLVLSIIESPDLLEGIDSPATAC